MIFLPLVTTFCPLRIAVFSELELEFEPGERTITLFFPSLVVLFPQTITELAHWLLFLVHQNTTELALDSFP